ncbi:hypothetical protein CK203_092465 [Vitis vinifera]|uniref:Uncharacterized protein n=1 Tax=Vitis vinifera TaxID=29760 RepID=A0A438EBU5_VITVI|nr:hypothetical protein CK203_092465 [Vitis vinifera]
MYRDGMWAMFRKEGSDHAGLTWMIEALSRLVSGLPMWVESIRRGEFFTSGKGIKTGRGGAAAPLRRGGAVAPLRKRGQLGEKGESIFLRSSGCKEGISRKGGISSILKGKAVSMEEGSYFREVMVGLRLAKEVIKVQQGWRANAVAHLNLSSGYSRSSANSATDWPCLLLEPLSQAAKIGLLWKIIALGVNERCLPVVLVTSDSYHSYQAYLDFRFPNIFISRETFGWTPQEAKLHMVTDYFSHSELAVIADVLGPNPRHMFELYALQQSNYYRKVMEDSGSTFEDIIDAYLSYLQITVVNPAMDKALKLLEKFVVDRLRFGAPWRHPPRIDNPTLCSEWTKLQLIDFVQSLVYPSLG